MSNIEYVSLTTGRTLFDCSPDQFQRFLENHDAVPQRQRVREAMEALGFTGAPDEAGKYKILDENGNVWVSTAQTEREAHRMWWRQVGLEQVAVIRARDQDWLKMRRRGRPAAEGGYREKSNSAETQARTLLGAIWNGVEEVVKQHSQAAAEWLAQSLEPRLIRYPRRRARTDSPKSVAHSLAHLYDLADHNQAVAEMFDGTGTLEAVAEAAGSEFFDRIARRVDSAGLLARMALMVALGDSERPEEVFPDLLGVLYDAGLSSRGEMITILEKI